MEISLQANITTLFYIHALTYVENVNNLFIKSIE